MTPEPSPEPRFVPLKIEIHNGRRQIAETGADFPVQVQQRNIVNNGGKAIAEACGEKTAEDVADRLNAEKYRREEDPLVGLTCRAKTAPSASSL